MIHVSNNSPASSIKFSAFNVFTVLHPSLQSILEHSITLKRNLVSIISHTPFISEETEQSEGEKNKANLETWTIRDPNKTSLWSKAAIQQAPSYTSTHRMSIGCSIVF